MLRSLFSVAACAVIAAVACGGSTDGSSVTTDQAASDVSSALCARANACASAYVSLVWGDATTCSAKLKSQFAGVLASNGTSWTPAAVDACAQAIPNATCDQILGRNLPSACIAKAGTLANGAACGDDSQCMGGHCNIPVGQVCGACSSFAAAGATCTQDADCDHGLVCVPGTSPRTCEAYVAQGAACDATHRCLPTLACKNGSCAAPDAAGTACTPNAGDTCDNLNGVFCNPQTKVCQQVSFVAPGAACGLVSGTLTLCKGGGGNLTAACKGITPPGYMGTCQASAADGASCDDVNGPACQNPSVCTNGVCKLDDPSSCK
jgi:hypothetical protein